MDLVRVAVLIPLLVVNCFSPGFFLVRRWRWTALETLCASVGISLLALYLASAAVYASGLDWATACWCFSGASAALLVIAWGDVQRLVANRTVRQGLYGYGFLFLWTLLMLAIIRVYSGGGWALDWTEHFQRVLYFLDRFPIRTPIVGGYQVPARPPMMNLLGAFFLAHSGDRFESFQLVFSFLNLLVFLPCYLLLPALAFRGRRRVLPLLVLFAASPVVLQNTTYTWTKMLATFYVLLALWFYLRGWSKQSSGRMVLAFALLAGGMLVHYSTGPYLLFLGLHFLLAVFWKRPNKWLELAAVVGIGGILLATWFGWSIAVYGTHSTVASNTSVTPSQQVKGGNLPKIAANFFDTLVPHPLRGDVDYAPMRDQPSALGRFRDYVFLIYQTNVIASMGSLGGLLVLYLLYAEFRRRSPRPDSGSRRFWPWMIAFCLVVGVAVHGERDPFGVAQVTLLPLTMLGLCLLAGSFTARARVLAFLLLAGCVVDFGVGVVPQVLAEGMENSPSETVFGGLAYANGKLIVGYPRLLSPSARNNWFAKHQLAQTQELVKQLSGVPPVFSPRALASVSATFANWEGEDAKLWLGWYSRHSGEITFLGDWGAAALGGSAIPLACLIAMFAASIVILTRQILHPLAANMPPKQPRKRIARR